MPENEEIQGQITRFYHASTHKKDLLPGKWNLDDEMEAIKRQVEADCTDPNCPNFVPAVSNVPKVVKKILAMHTRYQEATQEARATDLALMEADTMAETARMRAWAGIALLQHRALQPNEEHNHPIGG